MKKNMGMFLLSVVLLLFLVPPAFAENGTVKIKVDSESAGTVPAPVESNGVMLFPLAEIFKAAGYKVSTSKDGSNMSTVVEYAGLLYGATSGQATFDIFDKSGEYQVKTVTITPIPVKIGTSSVGVPLDYVRHEIGLAVTWDPNSRAINVSKAESKPQDVYSGNDQMTGGVFIKIGDSKMFTSNYEAVLEKPLDDQEGATPVIKDGNTLLPIATLIQEFGGTVKWDDNEKKVSITLDGNNVDIWLGKTRAMVNGNEVTLDVPPTIMNNRTMVPLRFVSENLGLELTWDGENQIIAIYHPWFKKEMPGSKVYSTFFTEPSKSDPETENSSPPSSDNQQQGNSATGTNSPSDNPNQQNTSDPLDKNGNLLHAGDLVKDGSFYGEVKKVNGARVELYLDSKDSIIPDKDVDFWSMMEGVRYKALFWEDAYKVELQQ